jgi:hypothetical protein
MSGEFRLISTGAAHREGERDGTVTPSAQCHDFGYLAWCDGCCDDAEDFILGGTRR